MGNSGELQPSGTRVDDLLGEGAPPETIEERQALASLEVQLFGASPRKLTLSRYVLLERLGAGGLGMVYAAYDPELDRRVAVKLLMARGDVDGKGGERLLREAQAMARLSHPNVIAVYDVGTYAERELWMEPGADPRRLEIPARGVFVVMELVEGETLAQWLARRPPWREAAKVMMAAGRGLAAAHAAGVIHRDFKPANVVVDGSGRARVLDFGLARAVGTDEPSTSTADPAGISGTPPYMSPEQHRGAAADERSDQYGFGVVLYEAIHGQRPFRGGLDTLQDAKEAGQWLPAPATAGVPSRVQAVIERALAPNPADRFPSMDALLAELERATGRRTQGWLAAGVLASVIAGTMAAAILSTPEDPCGGAAERIEPLWNADRRSRLERAFGATAVGYAGQAWAVVSADVDAYLEGWARMHRDACEATYVRHEQSDDVLDARMACLGHALGEVEALLDQFEDADAGVVENAVLATKSLSPLEPCADLDALASRVRPPTDAAARARVEQLRAELQEAKAEQAAARYADALARADAVAKEAAEIGYAPLTAEADLRRGGIEARRGDFEAAERHLLEAVWQAQRSRHERVAADAWIELVWVTGVERQRTDQGHLWAKFADVALDRAGADPFRRAMLTHHLGGVYYIERRYPEAYAHYERALGEQIRLLGAEDPLVARTLNHLGNVLMEQGQLERSYEHCMRSFEIRRRVLGADHPLVAASLNNLGSVRHRQGRLEEALDYARKALAITRGSAGPEEVITWRLIRMVASETGRDGDFAEATARLREIGALSEAPDR